jgi:FG-GAP-like repeat
MSTVNWENALGGDWSVVTNWELGLVPASNDGVQIVLPGIYAVTITSDVSAANLTINATGATLNESSVGSLTLSGDLSLYDGAVSLNGANSIGVVQLAGGLLAVGNGGALGNSIVLFYEGELLGTATEALTASIAFDGTPTIAAATGQTLSLEGDEELNGFGPSTLTFGAPGEAGTVLWEPANFQLLSVSPESLDIRAGELIFGNFDEGLTALSSAWNSVDIEAGATLDLAGVPSSFNTLAGSGTLTGSATSLVTIGGGYFSGNLTGYLNLDITGQVQLAGDSTIGNIDIGNGASLAALTNDTGGFIDLHTRSGISLSSGASNAFFVNDGTVLQNGPEGSSLVTVPFLNNGIMRIASGSVTFIDGFDNSGVVEGRLTTNGGTTTWTPDPAENDFSGNGLSDVLLASGSGSLVDWTMNGSAITSSNELTYQGEQVDLGPSPWTVAGLGDLNGDGKADILLCNSNGAFADWTMNGSTIESSVYLTYQGNTIDLGPSSPWTVAGLGDFNGDGMADILHVRRLDYERLDDRVRWLFDLSRQDSRSKLCMERRGNRRLQRRQQIGRPSA